VEFYGIKGRAKEKKGEKFLSFFSSIVMMAIIFLHAKEEQDGGKKRSHQA
jgi:hypothetical protein